MSATATVAAPRTSWFDRLVNKIKRGAKAVAAWFVRTAKAVGRGVKKVFSATWSGAKAVARYAVRGVGWVGRVVFGTVAALGTVVIFALLIVGGIVVGGLALAVLGWMEIVTMVRGLVLYGADFFTWVSRKNRGTFRAVREERVARREARYNRISDKIVAHFERDDVADESMDLDIMEEPVWFPAEADVMARAGVVDLRDEEPIKDEPEVEHLNDETVSAEVGNLIMHGLDQPARVRDLDWDSVPANRDLEVGLLSLANQMEDVHLRAWLHGRAMAVRAYLNAEEWDYQHQMRAMSLMLHELRNLSYPAKQLRRGFNAQVRAIDSQIRPKASV